MQELAINKTEIAVQGMNKLLDTNEQTVKDRLAWFTKLSTGLKIIGVASKNLQEEFHKSDKYINMLQAQVDDAMKSGLLDDETGEALKKNIKGALVIDPSKHPS